MNIVYQDDRHTVEVHDDRTVWFASDRGGLVASQWLCPHEAVAIGQALIAAGAEAEAQCCADGCMESATEFFGDDVDGAA